LAEYSAKYFVEATPACRESALAIRKFNEEILSPMEARVDLIRSTHPELHLPIGGKEYTDGMCISGHMQAAVDGATTFPGIAGVRAGLGVYRQKQEKAHYDPRCGTPLWKLMGRELRIPNSYLSDSNGELRRWADGRLPEFSDQISTPLVAQVESEISLEKRIGVARGQYLDRLQRPAGPSEVEKALAWHDLAAPIQLEVVLGSIEQACRDPQDYGKRLLLNDPVGRDFFASRPESDGMQWLYCHARRTYAHEVEQYNKDIDSLSLTLGLIGLSHPAVGLSVLPIEFGIEYTQWREADFQKRMDLALAFAGAGDYRLADRAIETLGSGEVTLYIGVAAMAAGGLGDAVAVADELVAAGARAGHRGAAARRGLHAVARP
jgi:hypothetical protein